MDHSCNCHSEISRDGSGQLDRYLKALDPSYAPVDDRSMEELLVFAKRYANQIRFYDIPESKVDETTDPAKLSWREFFRRDMAVIAASIGTIDIEKFKKDYEEQRVKAEDKPNHETFDDLFDPVLGMAAKIDGWYSLAIPENPLYADLELAINSNLKSEMQKIMAYEEGFKYVDSKHPLTLNYSAITNKSVWGLDETINADISIYQGSDNEEKIKNAVLYVDDIFNSFYGFIKQLISGSEKYMQFALEQYPAHQPHMALFITFLQLFRLAQDQMNGLTGRMLDFYYKDVLHLTTKPSIPDKAHIVFELAKDVAEYDIAQGTALKGGKDAGGKDQIYATENDLVVNGAKVKELKTIFIDKKQTTETQLGGIVVSKQFIQAIYARPVAKSKDGLGEPFTDPTPKWPTFGKGSTAIDTASNLCNQVALLDEADRKDIAQVGFAIASPQLVLQGGNRLIQIGLEVEGELFKRAAGFESLNGDKNFFKVSLTGEKEWFTVQNRMAEEDWNKLILKFKDESIGIFNPDFADMPGSYFLDAANKTIALYLPVAEPPVIAFNPTIHTGYDFKTTYPVARVMINPSINLLEEEYQDLTIRNILVNVKVGSINPSLEKQQEIIDSKSPEFPEKLFSFHQDGLNRLVLQNKDGLIAPDKPFDPFTAYPLPGRPLYIGSAEIFNKPFFAGDRLAINISKTLDVEPVDESGDDDTGTTDESGSTPVLFATATSAGKLDSYSVKILNRRTFSPITWTDTDGKKQIDFSKDQLATDILASADPNFPRTPITAVTEWKPETEKGFIRLDLLLNNRLFSLSASSLEARQNLASFLEIKAISVSYESTLPLQTGIDQFFHIYPFGVVETYLPLSSKKVAVSKNETDFATLDKQKDGLLVNANGALLPQFDYVSPYAAYYNTAAGTQLFNTALHSLTSNTSATNALLSRINYSKSGRAARLMLEASHLSDTTSGEANQYTGDMQQGMLFIGFEKLQPLQSISMLFQFAEGSAEDEDSDPPPVNWSYLSYNEWKPLRAEYIVSDGTYGFQTTGIIKIDIPQDASTHNTIITDGLLWLCASVTENANRIPQLIDIVTQAVKAQFQDNGNAPSHFDAALPAGNISKLVTPVAQVSKVQQPFASFDGKHSEVGKEFYTRVSERLRHKGRAITAWDYEHLVLNRFPSVYKVKCITHTDPNCLCRNTEDGKDCCGPQVAPGHVLIIPIAYLKNRNAANPLQPKTSRRTLIAIQEYLKMLTSPFVHIHAKNPVYEQIIVKFKVQFYSGTDKGFYIKKLNEELVHFLTPWAFDDNAAVAFNQKIYASSIINFIEERPYVDFITDFVMGVCCNECCPPALTPAKVPITIRIEDSNKSVLQEVTIKENGVENTASFDQKNYSISTSNNDPAEVTLSFYKEGYISQQILVGEKTTLHITLYRYDEAFAYTNNCDDIAWISKTDSNLNTDIVAKPCTARSILVSVPQHIIIPYEAPPELSPCDKPKISGSTGKPGIAAPLDKRIAATPENLGTSIPINKEEANTATDKSSTEEPAETKKEKAAATKHSPKKKPE